MIALWTLATYLIASIPYSVLLGKWIFGVDIREYGDGNPGATNVYRASGSKFWFIVAVCLDGAKGLFPVGIAYWMVGIRDMGIVPIALAAIAGHAFSVFLRFDGGKAVAVTFGTWIGLTIFEMPLVMGIMLVYWFRSLKESNWVVVVMMLYVLLYLLLTRPTYLPFLAIWLGNFLIVLFRHRQGLNQLPTIKRWLPLLPKDGASAA
ncbi:MAG: glycerol-3-phosphate acyltransferase [Anaerolineae bacterium]|nr:glycerol-3-phosphate acyltransferase [Anaerolineae bacterium]